MRRNSREPLPTSCRSRIRRDWKILVRDRRRSEYWLEMVGKNIRSRIGKSHETTIPRAESTLKATGTQGCPFNTYACTANTYVPTFQKSRGTNRKKIDKETNPATKLSRRTVGQWNCSIEDRIRIVGRYMLGYILRGETNRRRGRGRRR